MQFGVPAPSKEKKYIYNYENTTLSSGALVDPKPSFRYMESFSTKLIFVPYGGIVVCSEQSGNLNTFYYNVVTTENNTPLLKTQGSAVGYKHVALEETDKGKITYEYTSPLDSTNSAYPQGPPFVQPKNFDYKRGNLIKQTVYDNNLRKLSETENIYDYVDYEEYTGIKFWKPNNIYHGTSENYPKRFDIYQSSLTNGNTCMQCNSNYRSPKSFWGGMPLDINTPNFIPVPVFETYGWTKLTSTNTKTFFYENGAQKFTEKNEFFEYNPLNKQISQHIAEAEDGIILKTKYFYHTGNSTYSQNRISEIEKIESYKNGQLLETKKINYANNWNANVSYLPYQIQTSFGSSSLDTELTYDKYDSNGNLQQYTTKDGVPVFILWGYNNTQVIAKIIGSRFISNNLIDITVAASNQDALNPINEPALITALDNLRKDPSFSSYQITTYTYDPLIGVTSITPPSGIREVYLYDSANRLKEIRQDNATGKLLKEFKYNYKP